MCALPKNSVNYEHDNFDWILKYFKVKSKKRFSGDLIFNMHKGNVSKRVKEVKPTYAPEEAYEGSEI